MAGALLLLVLAFLMFNRYRLKEKTNKLLESQNHIISEKNKDISDSINYAKKIQDAILPSIDDIQKVFPESFILSIPKDVVSGDFYWGAATGSITNEKFILATADSTGHGVPGAIMSILNISCLKESVKEGILQPAEILNRTRKLIIDTLALDGSAEGGKDGMDASLTIYDFKNKKLIVSSANNPVWIIRGTETIEIKADKMPVGKHDKQNISFTQQEIQLQSGDVVYSLTDGFPDQFGGPKGKKFMYKNLEKILIESKDELLEVQKNILDKEFDKWKGSHEQIDDVCIIGLKI